MKALKIIPAAAMLAFLSCNNPSTNDSTDRADSINDAKTDTAGSMASGMTVDDADTDFAVEAANGGMAEVELGKLAQQKAANAQVKEFGTMMVTDHSKANEELKALAASKNITLPASINDEEQQVKDDLSAKSGSAFDKAYVDEMVKDHKKDIQLFEDARNTVEDAEIKQFIDNTLPVLNNHLQHIQEIQKTMK